MFFRVPSLAFLARRGLPFDSSLATRRFFMPRSGSPSTPAQLGHSADATRMVHPKAVQVRCERRGGGAGGQGLRSLFDSSSPLSVFFLDDFFGWASVIALTLLPFRLMLFWLFVCLLPSDFLQESCLLFSH